MHQMMEAREHQKKAFVSRLLEEHRKQEFQAPLMYNRLSVKEAEGRLSACRTFCEPPAAPGQSGEAEGASRPHRSLLPDP